MHFLKTSLIACSVGLAVATATNNDEYNNAVRDAAEAQITTAPVVIPKRDWTDLVSSAIDLAKSEGSDWVSRGKSIADEVKSDADAAASSAANWVSTKGAAASSLVESVRSRVSAAAGTATSATNSAASVTNAAASATSTSDGDSAAVSLGRDSMVGMMAAVVALGATAFGYIFA